MLNQENSHRLKQQPKRSSSRNSEVEGKNSGVKTSVLTSDNQNNLYLTMRAVNLKKMKRSASCQSNNSSNLPTEPDQQSAQVENFDSDVVPPQSDTGS